MHFYTLITNYQKEKFPFTTASKRIKYLGINQPTEIKDMYSENYEKLMKEAEDETKRYKDILCSRIQRIYSAKMSAIKVNLQIQCNPYKNIKGILHRTKTNDFKMCVEPQKTTNSQNNLEKEEPSWRNRAP